MRYGTGAKVRRAAIYAAAVATLAVGGGAAFVALSSDADAGEHVSTQLTTAPTALFGPTPTTAAPSTTTTTSTTTPPTTSTTSTTVLPAPPTIRVDTTGVGGSESSPADPEVPAANPPVQAPTTTVPPRVSVTAIYVVPERDASRHGACRADQMLFFPDADVYDHGQVLLATEELPDAGTFVSDDELGNGVCEFPVTFDVPLGPSYEFMYGVQSTPVSAAQLEQDGSQVRIAVADYYEPVRRA